MVKCAFIMASALIEANRWDVGFHLLQDDHKEQIAELKQTMTKDQATATAISIFETVPVEYRKLLAPLLRGSDQRSPSTEALIKTVEAYPFHTIAVFQSARDEIKASLQDEIDTANAARAKLIANFDGLDRALSSKS